MRPACPECQAIYREFRNARRVDQAHPPLRLADWLREFDEEECAHMRETSDLWKTWRRMREHRALTGHSLSPLDLPPDAISNSN